MQKSKNRISLVEKIKHLLTPSYLKREQRSKTREYKRWANGWKRNCTTSSQIRRIGSRVRAIELGIVKK